MLYGEKFIGFHKLSQIQSLIQLGVVFTTRVAATKLVRSTGAGGKERKITLENKLLSLNLPSSEQTFKSDSLFTDNSSIPSLLFILGLWLGDGCLFLRFRLVPKSGSIWIIPMFSRTL